MIRFRVKPDCVVGGVYNHWKRGCRKAEGPGCLLEGSSTWILKSSRILILTGIVLERVTVNQVLESLRYAEELTSHSKDKKWVGFRGQLDQDVP